MLVRAVYQMADPLSFTMSGGSLPSRGLSVILGLLLLVAKILIPLLLHQVYTVLISQFFSSSKVLSKPLLFIIVQVIHHDLPDPSLKKLKLVKTWSRDTSHSVNSSHFVVPSRECTHSVQTKNQAKQNKCHTTLYMLII